MTKPPTWCAKGKPCDYDAASSYCLHRECRQQLEAQFIEQGSRLDHAANDRDKAEQLADARLRRIDELLRRLGELILPWRAEPPTETGYYWHRKPKPDEDILGIKAVQSIQYGDGRTELFVDLGHPVTEIRGEWAGPIPMPPTSRVAEQRAKCDGCGHEIDPDTCGCGNPMEPHYDSTHSPIPMGCDCGRAVETHGKNS